jgi:WD40 repeat protein
MPSDYYSRPVRLYLIFAREDHLFGNTIIKHLAILKHNGIIDNWHEQEVAPGSRWHDVNNERLYQADIILLGISPDFIASDYHYSTQMQQALERHHRGEAWVIPILFRPTFWNDLPIAHLHALPVTKQGEIRAISLWENQDEAYVAIVAGIKRAIEARDSGHNEISPSSNPSPSATKKPISSPGTLHFIYPGHSAYVIDVSWSPNGKYIASGGGDSTVRVWEASSGNTLYTYRGQKGIILSGILFSQICSIAWSPDNTLLAFAGRKAPIVWNPHYDQKISTYQGHSPIMTTIMDIAWSPDGQWIASTNNGSPNDPAIHVWGPLTGYQKARIAIGTSWSINPPAIGGVAWAPDNRRIACGMVGEIRIYEVDTRRHLQSYHYQSAWASHSVRWTRDGKTIIGSFRKRALAWDIPTGNSFSPYTDHTANIRDLAVSPDDRYVASASNDTTVHIWETRTGKRVFKYEGHKDEVAAVTWSPDGTRIASACQDGAIHVWQAM